MTVFCLYQLPSAIVKTPFLAFVSLFDMLCFFDIGLLFQSGPPLPDKDQSQQGPLLNDNTLRSQLVFTAEEEECIKASGLIVVVFSFTNWLGASKPLIQFRGKAAIRGRGGGKGEWKLQIKSQKNKKELRWVAFLKAEANVEIKKTRQTCGRFPVYSRLNDTVCVFPRAK